MSNTMLSGKPDAGNPHFRFDEMVGTLTKPKRGILFYNRFSGRTVAAASIVLRRRLLKFLTFSICIVFFSPSVFGRLSSLCETIGGVEWYGDTIEVMRNGIIYEDGASIRIPSGLSGKVSIPTTIEGYTVKSIASSILTDTSSITDITIPSSVTDIDGWAFYGFTSLTSIIIPLNVTHIGHSAFSQCSSLADIVIPSKVTEIDEYAFSGCESLTNAVISKGVTYIGADMFTGCTALRSVSIPSSVVDIKFGAFKYCESLVALVVPDSVTNMESHVFYETPTFVLFEGLPPAGTSFLGNNVGFYRSEYAQEWECVIDEDGKWRDMLMMELSDDDKLGYFVTTDVRSGVWLQNQDYYDYTGFDETMGTRANPKDLFTQGKDVAYAYGYFNFNNCDKKTVTIRYEIDTGSTGLYWAESQGTFENGFYFRRRCSIVEGFPTMGGLGSYTFKTTVSCDGYEPVSKSVDFQVECLEFTFAEALSADAASRETMAEIDFPQGSNGTSGNKWFASCLDLNGVINIDRFAQSGLCGKGQTSVLDMRVFEPFLMTFSTGVTGGTLDFISGVNGNYQERIMSCGNGTYSVIVGTNDTEWVRWVFTRGNSEYKLDEACYAALGNLEFENLCHVSFDSNGGSSTCTPIWAIQGKSYNSIEPFPEEGPAPPEPVKDTCGCIIKTYEFDGWYLGDDCVTGASITPDTSSVKLYARWRENKNPQPKNGEKPNLVVNITVDPTEGTLDDRFKFEVTVSNVGDWDAGPFWTRLYLDGEKFSADMYSECLAVGKQRIHHRRRRGTSFGPGRHVMTAVVDYADSVSESNEGDNSSSCTFTVVEIPIPEIKVNFAFATPPERVDSFYLSADTNGQTICTSFAQGDPIYIFMGCRNTEESVDKLFVNASLVLANDQDRVGEEEFALELKGVQTSEISGDERKPALLQDLEPGNYTLKCVLDPYDEYEETDEADNMRTIAFIVGTDGKEAIVQFNANGGHCETASKIVQGGNAIGTLPTATWDGYDFLGWFTSENGGTQVSAATIVTENLVLYAHWQEHVPEPPTVSHTVTFELGEHGTRTGGGELTQTVEDGAAAEAPTVTAEDGWRFTGWDVDFSTVTGDLTVTAVYEAVQDAQSLRLNINTGWNWISLNVTPTNAAIGAVFAGVAFADEDVIKSADGSATYYGGTWYGELTTIKPGVAYMVKMSSAESQTLTVTGSAAATSVEVVSGWNWIGPTATAEVSLDALTHSGGFTDEDVIKSADATATYYGGKWYGELKALKPGVGYKAKFAKGGALSFSK